MCGSGAFCGASNNTGGEASTAHASAVPAAHTGAVPETHEGEGVTRSAPFSPVPSLLVVESAAEIPERRSACAAAAPLSSPVSSDAAHAGPTLPAFSTPPPPPPTAAFPSHTLSTPGPPMSSDVCTAAAAHSTADSAGRMYDGAVRRGAMCVETKALRARAAAKLSDASPFTAGLRGARESVSPLVNCCIATRGARGAALEGGDDPGVGYDAAAPHGTLDPTPAIMSLREVPVCD